MAPFLSGLRISHDYPVLIKEQIELLFSINTGSFPLYVPGYHLGHSSMALTMGQLFHPISYIASLLPGYWSGKALEWNTFLRLSSLGLTQLALFSFLKQIRLNTLFSFILSLITVYNLRMLEAFRYGASMEAFTAHLFLCAMIGKYYISPSKWLVPLSLIGATYLLACSGHPPMMFYGFAAIGLFTLVIPFILPDMLSDRKFSVKSALDFWLKVGILVCLGIALSSAYIVPLYFEFVKSNNSYSQSAGLIGAGLDAPETLAGALNNFFLPFFADLLGSFGGSSLIIIAFLLPLLRFFKVKIPLAIWFLWGIVIYALLFIQGPVTPVYALSHKYIPFISSLGGVGRIAMILPSVLMLLMVWIINAGAFSIRTRGASVTLTPCSLLGLAALILTPVYLMVLFLLRPEFGYFTPHFMRHIPFSIEIISVLFGLLSLAMLVVYNMYPRLARTMGILLCLAILLQIGTILKYGMFIEKKKDEPTFDQLISLKKDTLGYSFYENPNAQHRVVSDHLSRSFMEPFLGKLFTQVIPVSNQDEAYIQMQKKRLQQDIFVEDFDPEKAKIITGGAKDMNDGMVELLYSSFNRLQFRVNSQAPAFFGLSYPYTGHWRAWVNGEKVRVYRGNGAAHAVEIPEGKSLIEFRYWSNAFFWGILLSCIIFNVIGLYVCFHALGGYLRVTCIVLVLVIGTGGFMLWYNSLYTGDNLNTKYQWTYTSPQPRINIAYGKKTSGYSLPSASFIHWHSSKAVDGDIRPGSGLPLGITEDKEVIVDLNNNEEIKSIVLYGEITASPDISLSQDGIKWKRVSSILENNKNSPLRIIFEKPQVERYIKVKSSEGTLYIDELEVYKNL
ncbi:MAG: YfhO family protein [Candidatus Omnitrophica bacterium]|nr:YfhO family protein [Candidatus Omnitrophota bacterium]